MSLFRELKRRNVFRVGIAYGVVAWLLAQMADLLLDNFGAPDWVIKVFLLALLIGFPLALFFAWAYELTPEGVKKEREVDRSQSITRQTGRKLDFLIIGVLAAAVVLLLADRFWDKPGETDSAAERPPTTAADPVGGRSAADGAVELPATSAKSIAVLPFADLSQAGDQEWFADGLAEEILNPLAKTPDLLVASRTSSCRYKKSELDMPRIAAELGVAHVLEGSVRSSGDRIRVTAQLIRASDGFHLWSENYDRDVADMIAIQEDLALNIAQALETTMDPAALAKMTSAGTRSVEAYQDCLKGLSLLANASSNSNAAASTLEAYERFEQARATDPKFSSAHAMAANFWLTQLSPTLTASGLTELEPLQMASEFSERINLAL